MKTIVIETWTSNNQYPNGWQGASQDTERAKAQWICGLLSYTRPDAQPVTLDELNHVLVGDAEFIEADSNRSHGSCYFSIPLEVPESLFEKLDLES